MRIKTNDMVKVIAGKDKGKVGKVLKTFPKKDRVLVENVNMVTKHTKPQGPTKPGGIEKKANPIHVSNGTKLGYRFENGKKVRFKKSDNETIK